MKSKIRLSVLATALALSTAVFADEAKTVDSIADMFKNGEVSGQIRLGYINVDAATSGDNDTSATAIGGQLKFETASLNGVSLGAAAYTSQAIRELSGDQRTVNNKFNEELTSSEKNYTELAEAYINYANGGFNLRIGRQVLDTPLADSDDIRMTPHTFEAIVASYNFSEIGLTLIGANVQRWQGVDADYANVTDDRWAETNGEGGSGTWMGAAVYSKDNIDAGAWYYKSDKLFNAIYVDGALTLPLGEAELVLGAQYLDENDETAQGGGSTDVEGSIAGIMAEASVGSFTAMAAYNMMDKKAGKSIIEGFGGGSSYTNMDTNTAGLFADAEHEDGQSYVLSLGYEISDINFIAAYGDFKADGATGFDDSHATEIDLGVEYAYNDSEVEVALYYVMGEDKESSAKTELDDDHIQLTVNYNF